MIYLLAKAAHIVSLFIWLSGMTAVALALRYPAGTFLSSIRVYDRAVTTPAMIMSWSLGLLLAVQGDWFPEPWLGLKILFALCLSGLHGALAGKLRRATSGRTEPQPSARWYLHTGLVTVVCIVLLVTIKP